MNPNDGIRQQILHWFYDRNSNATSQHGKRGSAVKISDAKKGLKGDCGLAQTQVVSNLNYLIDKNWINRTEVEKQVRTPRGTLVPATQTWYEISSGGIDKIEGDSEFRNGGKFAGINVHATGTNVITLGDGNIVNVKYERLREELKHLKELAVESNLSEKEKLDIVVDIESTMDQLAKARPDNTILGHLWDRITEVATIGGFLDAVQGMEDLVRPLITGEF